MRRTGILLLTVNLVCMAQPRYIGTVNCSQNFWVDSAGVSNHATIFENSVVETESAPARLLIADDVRVLLDAHSRAQINLKRLVLERGRAQLDNGLDYKIEVRSVHISLTTASARAIVSADASGTVEVAALGGEVHVANAEGVAVANVAAGRAVELRLQQTSETAVLTGCIVKTGGTYTLRDEASAVTVELRGSEVASDVGRRVEVSGAIVPAQRALAAADQVVRAKTIQILGSGCGLEAAAVTGSRARAAQPDSTGTTSPSGGEGAGSTAGTGAGGSAGTAGAASTTGAAGASTGIGVSTAVIAGIAVAAAAGTAAAIVATHGHKPPISPGR